MVVGIVGVIMLARILARLIRKRSLQPQPPRERLSGSAVTTWSDVYSKLEQFAPTPSRELATDQVRSLESLFGGIPDFGFINWREDYVNVVVVKEDWFHDIEVGELGDKIAINSGRISSLARVGTQENSDGGLRLNVGHGSVGWHWDAQDAEAREGLLSFAERLRSQSKNNQT